MKIEWVNHASFILDHDDIRLITDPWIEGTVFDNGWALLSETKFTYDDFDRITHIWFSHEHPDHFNPPNLKQIPSETRKKITVLFQETADKKVIEWCKKLNFFAIIELKKDTWYKLSDQITLMCNPVFGDSWLCIKTNNVTLLNINDCVITSIEELKSIQDKVGQVDILLTQFSYANWVGNVEDIIYRQKQAEEKLDTLIMQTNVLKPKYVVPFASFVWFCHQENEYMNADVNKIGAAHNMILKETNSQCIVLYPGEIWDINQPHDSSVSIEKYQQDYRRILNSPNLFTSKKVELTDLIANSHKFSKQLLNKNNPDVLEFLHQNPTTIFLTDHCKGFTFTVNNGLESVNCERDYCDVSLSSDALNYCFLFLWGGDTLNINGRFQIPKFGNYVNFRKFFLVSSLNNREQQLDLPYLQKIIGIISVKYKHRLP